MRKRNKQLIAYFLLLCLSMTLLPSSAFSHNHKEESHSCEINTELEKNACHLSVYHSEFQENHCEHERHFSKSTEDCDFCEYINSRRQLLAFNEYEIVLITPHIELVESQTLLIVHSNRDEPILGRAPPTI